MKKTVLAACFCSLSFIAFSQPCQPASICDEAPILCGFNLHGLQAETPPQLGVNSPAPFNCGTLENNTWLGFTPCENSVALEIQVFNCSGVSGGAGMQAEIFYTDDCLNFIPMGNCLDVIYPGTSAVVVAGGLTPGEVYYLMLDGWKGDFCQYQINVLQGIDVSPPQPVDCSQATPGYLNGPTEVGCDDDGLKLGTYTIVPTVVPGAGGCPAPEMDCIDIQWNIPPGAFISSANADLTQVTIDFTDAVSGIVSVDFLPNPQCSCYCGDFCLPAVQGDYELFVTVLPAADPQEVVLPIATLCQPGISLNFCGSDITVPGTYQCLQGCLKLVQEVTVGNASVSISNDTISLQTADSVTLDASISPGAAVTWSGSGIDPANQHLPNPTISEPGIYQVVVTDTASGCSASASVVVFPTACASPNSPVPPGDDCQSAPPFCASLLAGFCSSNLGYTADLPGNLLDQLFCTVENNQWLRFTACSDTARFQLAVGDCTGGGLEFSVLQSFDCQYFTALANCFTLTEGDTGTLVATDLTVGQTYFLMVDGVSGDACGWQILAVEGVSNGVTVQEENTPGYITNLGGTPPPSSACLTAPVVLTLTFVPPVCNLLPVDVPGECPAAEQQICQNPQPPGTCAFDTIWHVEPPGAIFENGDSTGAVVTIIFPDTLDVPPFSFLEFTISVSILPVPLPGGLPCHENCLTECLTVLSDSAPCAIFPHKIKLCKPDARQVSEYVCEFQQSIFFEGSFYGCGNHTIVKPDPCGCSDVTELFVGCLFEPPASASQPSFQCDASGDFYTVSYTFTPPYYFYLVNGIPIGGSGYTSPPIPSGQPYSLNVTPVSQCPQPSFTLLGSHTCPCQPETFQLGVQLLCPGECFNLFGIDFCSPGTYTQQIVDPGGCTDTYVFTVQVQNPPPLSIGIVTTDCDATNLNYWVTFTIADGTPPYFVNGVPSGGVYVSSPIPTGQGFFFEVTDSGVCGGSSATLADMYICDPFTDAGTMSQAMILPCESQIASATWNDDAELDGNDALIFVLHDNSGTWLGNVLAINTSGEFAFLPGAMNLGQTYFISAVAGNQASGGGVDFGDPNLSVAQGQPVIFYADPTLSATPPPKLTCAQPTGILTASPGGGSGDFSFEWSYVAGVFSTQQNPVASAGGNYTCVTTDNVTGCTAMAFAPVDEDKNPPNLTVAGCDLTCAQPACDLLAHSFTPGVIFTWALPGGGSASGASVTAGAAGEFFVIATNTQNGCTAQAQTEVIFDSAALAEVILPDVFLPCSPAAMDFCGTQLTVWADTQLACVVGCERRLQNVIFQTAPPIALLDMQGNCDPTFTSFQVSFGISGGTPPYFVNGSPSSNSFISNPLSSGSTFTFQVTDSGFCSDEETVTGVFNCDPITFSGTMNLQATSACGDEIVAASWNNNATLDANDAVVFVLHDSPGGSLGNVLGVNATGIFAFDPATMSYGQPYFVSAVAGNAAPGGVDFNDPYLSVSPGQPVTFYQIPSLDLLPPDTLTCLQTSVMLNALTDAPGSTFAWSAPGFVSNEQNPVTTAAGSYGCTVTDASGTCSASANVLVLVDTLPPDLVASDGEITCQNTVCQLIATSATPDVSLVWTFPTGEILTGGNISTDLPGSYSVQAIAANGCVSQASAEVTDARSVPDLQVVGDTIFCKTSAVLQAFSSTPGVVFTWSLPDGTTATGANLSVDEPGEFYVIAAEPAGCTNEAAVQVWQTDPLIQPFFEVKSPTCFDWEDGFIRLDSLAGGTPPYLILSGFPSDFPLENIGAGEYPLTITDANGCETDTSILLQNPPPVTVELGDDLTVWAGENVALAFQSSIVPAKIQWENSGGLSLENQALWQLQPAVGGTFWVVVEDENGCAATDSLRIFLKESEQVFVPNAFSPNGDGRNDRLTVFTGEDVAQVRSFRIFDRWGDQVFVAENFQPNDPNKGWDGQAKGKLLDPAVFVFLAELEMKSGEVSLIAGDVTLIR